MGDTLRSIVNEMVHSPSSEIVRGDGVVESRTCLPSCYRCRLEALLAEYEKVNLVKTWRTKEWEEEHLSRLPMGMMFDPRLACADELETWLAVNLERIKAQARLEEAMVWLKATATAPLCNITPEQLKDWERERITTLEAKAKEKP